jgi:Ca2+/H+ antiporter
LITVIGFIVALVVILLGAAFFTNAVEILGSRLGMRQGLWAAYSPRLGLPCRRA